MDELTGRARLTVTDRPDDAGLVAAFAGELDIAGLPEVTAPLDDLLARDPQPLRLDLTELEFLDSTGVTLLIRMANRFDPVEAVGATVPVRRVLQVLGLSDRLGLADPPGRPQPTRRDGG